MAAKLFHHAGQNEEAETQIRKVLGRYDIRSNADRLQLFAAILGAQNRVDEQHKVLELLADKAEHSSYEEVLETGLIDQHRYKVGLKLSKQDNANGVLVVKAYEQYPFHKAGVRAGDYLLEFGHRKITSLRTISILIYNFTPGTDVPLKLRRGGETLDLTVVIE